MNTQKKNAIIVISTFIVITIIMVLLIPIDAKQKRYKEFGKLAEAAETDKRAEYIIDNIEQYPEYIVDIFYSEPDSLEFIYNYPNCKDNYASMSYTEEELSGGVPELYMDDPRWAYECIGNYDEIIKTHGCAYVCMTMAYIGLTGDSSVDPVFVGNIAYENMLTSKISAGLKLDNIGKLSELIGLNGTYYNFNTERGGTALESVDEIAQHISDDCVIIAGMVGETFGNHAVIISKCDGNDIQIIDPGNPGNTKKIWNFENLKPEFRGVWVITK